MAYNVFLSYSTKDMPLVNKIKNILEDAGIEVFVAEYSVPPGNKLNNSIISAIKKCDLFVLVWSKNSKSSEYVQQEIGIAKGNNKIILPIVLHKKLELPAFISDIKYMKAYERPEESLKEFQEEVVELAMKRKKQTIGTILLIGGLILLLTKLDQKKLRVPNSISKS